MSVILICVLLQSARQLELPAGTLYWLFCETLKLRAVYVSYLLLRALPRTGLLLVATGRACRKCREEIEENWGLVLAKLWPVLWSVNILVACVMF